MPEPDVRVGDRQYLVQTSGEAVAGDGDHTPCGDRPATSQLLDVGGS